MQRLTHLIQEPTSGLWRPDPATGKGWSTGGPFSNLYPPQIRRIEIRSRFVRSRGGPAPRERPPSRDAGLNCTKRGSRVDATVAGTIEVTGIHAAGHCVTPACDARATRASPAPPAGVADLVSRVRSGTVRGPVDGGATSPSHRRASPGRRPDSLGLGAHDCDRGDRHRRDRTDHP